ncbi:MAG: methyltransferase domain-containing protein [Tissierellales bacterium]|nr:methyltransferase domain-containing protein [Tissierellales bacterium]
MERKKIIHESKYYDYVNNRPLNMESDGCDLADWDRLYGDYRFARHPKGFKIFLAPDRLAVSDEYFESDPYAVEQNIDSEFQTRRIELTISLVYEAVSSVQDAPQILDIGCGQGHITEKIHQSINGAQVSGLDYSVSAIEYAHEHFSQIDFAVGDAYDSPYSPGFFDVVVCNNLWEHVPDPLFLLSRIKRIMKPGGYLILSTPSRYRAGNLVRILRGNHVAFMSRHHITEYTVGQVQEQLAYGGFEVRRMLSKPISSASPGAKVVRLVLSILISIVGSHHQLEATVFYLAQEATKAAEFT